MYIQAVILPDALTMDEARHFVVWENEEGGGGGLENGATWPTADSPLQIIAWGHFESHMGLKLNLTNPAFTVSARYAIKGAI